MNFHLSTIKASNQPKSDLLSLAKKEQSAVSLNVLYLVRLIHVNDMHRSSKKFDFYLFADDTNLLYAGKGLNKLEVVVNEELLKLCEWLNSNKSSLNASKSNFVIFYPYQRKLDREVNLKILDDNSKQLVSLERKTYVKYLGVLIDGNLSYKHHINYISISVLLPGLDTWYCALLF